VLPDWMDAWTASPADPVSDPDARRFAIASRTGSPARSMPASPV